MRGPAGHVPADPDPAALVSADGRAIMTPDMDAKSLSD
jgi:hypothetical protein